MLKAENDVGKSYAVSVLEVMKEYSHVGRTATSPSHHDSNRLGFQATPTKNGLVQVGTLNSMDEIAKPSYEPIENKGFV